MQVSERKSASLSKKNTENPTLRKGLYSALFCAYYVFVINRIVSFNISNDGFRFGDWLINYSQGFVRRGLLGNIFIVLKTSFNVPLVLSLSIFEGLALAFVFYFVWSLIVSKPHNVWLTLLVFSPIGFFYTLNEFRYAGLKEILFIAFLGLVYYFKEYPIKSFQFALLIALWMTVIFSHEGLIFFIGYPIAILFLATKSRQGIKAKIITFVSSSAVSAAIIYLFGFAKSNSQALCQKLLEFGEVASSACSGSIKWLQFDTKFGMQYVAHALNARFLSVYIFFALIALALGFLTVRSSFGDKRKIYVFLLLSWLLACPLFAIGTDWGRWIYIHSTSIMILLLILRKDQTEPKEFKLQTLKTEFLLGILWLFSMSVTLGGGHVIVPILRAWHFFQN